MGFHYFSGIRKIVFVLATIIAGISACSVHEETDSSGSILVVGDPLPSCVMDRIAEVQGTPLLIVFFNPSCVDCQNLMAVLRDYNEENSADLGFTPYLIGRDMTEADFEEYRRSGLGPDWDGCADPDREIYGLFATKTIPRVYLCHDDVIKAIWLDENLSYFFSLLTNFGDNNSLTL